MAERSREAALTPPSLEGRGWGWVGEQSEPGYARPMRRIPDDMTANARALRTNATQAEKALVVTVIPAKAGIQTMRRLDPKPMDPRFRGDDRTK